MASTSSAAPACARWRSAIQAIRNGDSEIVVAGGQESMSLAPHCMHLRNGTKMGDAQMIDTMIKDGLWDAFNGYHMGITAENVAQKWQITREQQDEFAAALAEQGRGGAEGRPVQGRDRPGHHQGPQGRRDRRRRRISQGTAPPSRSLAKLRPAFNKDGTVTAGNASGINDGAAALVLMSAEDAAKRGLKPLARIVSWATAGVDPAIMGSGPIPASRAALEKAGWKAERPRPDRGQRGLRRPGLRGQQGPRLGPGKVNVNGGAIALGHPIGASGARVLVTLLHEMQKRDAKKGLATLCIGGGMGIALSVER